MRIVLAYSGGLRATAAIPWLRERHRADVIAVTLDLGQGRALESVRDRALAAGALRAHVVDARDAFARDVVVPALRAGATGVTPRMLGQVMLGRTLVDVARIERAVAVGYAAAPGSGDADRIERPVRALDRGLTLLPVTQDAPAGRAALADYLRLRHLDVPLDDESDSADANLWGRTLATSANEPPADHAFTLTRPSAGCSAEPAIVDLQFERGTPISINGVAMPFPDLVQSLGTIAGAHGVGRLRIDGAWVEAPAASVLQAAHQALRDRVLDDEMRAFAATVSRRYVGLITEGAWYHPLREALDAFVEEAECTVSGSLRVQLCRTQLSTLDEPKSHAAPVASGDGTRR